MASLSRCPRAFSAPSHDFWLNFLSAAHEQLTLRRTGTLWEGRYKAAPIDSDRYFSCCRYIDLNPVRARMVDHPRHYRWSSYRAHAEGKDDALATFHPVFHRLGCPDRSLFSL